MLWHHCKYVAFVVRCMLCLNGFLFIIYIFVNKALFIHSIIFHNNSPALQGLNNTQTRKIVNINQNTANQRIFRIIVAEYNNLNKMHSIKMRSVSVSFFAKIFLELIN